jgi:hypothetical protein
MSQQDLRVFCRKTYQDYLKRAEIPSELRRSLKSHERVPAFIDNLSGELGRLQFKISRETLQKCIEDMCELFIRLVQRRADEQAMSPLARAMLVARETKFKEMKAQADELERLGVDHVTQDEKGETIKQVVTIDDPSFI